MNPITREEQYLNRLTGEEGIIPDKPVTREEQYFARLCGGDNVIPDKPVTRREQYLATLCGEDVITPTKPVTRIEQYMAFASGESESKPEKPITREEMYWDKYQGGDVPEEKTIAFTDIITVTDALARPAVDLQAEITATQNLNGYEYPWVGGAGKNLLPKLKDGTYSGNGVTAVVKDGIATLSGTTTTSGNALIIPLDEAVTVPNQTCYLHSMNSVQNGSVQPSIEKNGDAPNTAIAFALSPVNRITEIPQNRYGVTVDQVRFYLGSGVTLSGTFSPMICLTDTATAYAPYENICPISGRTKVNVTRTGANLLPFNDVLTEGWTNTLNGITATYSNGVMRVVGTSTSDEPTNIVTFYFIWASNPITLGAGKYVMANHLTISASIDGASYAQKTTAFTAEESVAIRGFWISVPARQTVDWTIPMLFVEGDTFNTALGRTVYGGVLDLTTGELTLTHAYVDLGDLTWTVTYLDVFQVFINEKKVGSTNFITTSYRTVDKGYADLANGEATSISPMSHGHFNTYIGIKDERATTAEEFTTLVTGQKMVYELATPQTISLTPTEVMMLENNNTIWADSGRVQLTYLSKAAEKVQLMNASLKANTLKLTKGAIKE